MKVAGDAAPIRNLAIGAPFDLWLVDTLQPLPDQAMLALSADELARAHRFHAPQHADRYRRGHAALRLLLSQFVDMPMGSLQFVRDGWGKPRLAGTPGLHFSISYAGNAVLVGIAWRRPIGVDLEPSRPIPDAHELAGAHFTPDECAQVDTDQAFLTGWTRKEACVKALGPGLGVPLVTVACGVCPEPAIIVVAGTAIAVGSFEAGGHIGAWAQIR